MATATQLKGRAKMVASRGTRNNNPGNLKHGDFTKLYGAVSEDDQGHAIFPAWEDGFLAMQELLTRPKYQDKTLHEVAITWAESWEPWQWIVGYILGIKPDEKPDLSTPIARKAFCLAIMLAEGSKPRIPRNITKKLTLKAPKRSRTTTQVR